MATGPNSVLKEPNGPGQSEERRANSSIPEAHQGQSLPPPLPDSRLPPPETRLVACGTRNRCQGCLWSPDSAGLRRTPYSSVWSPLTWLSDPCRACTQVEGLGSGRVGEQHGLWAGSGRGDSRVHPFGEENTPAPLCSRDPAGGRAPVSHQQ